MNVVHVTLPDGAPLPGGPSAFDFHEAPTFPDARLGRVPAKDAPLVLVVDDDEDMRFLVATTLEVMGYRTATVGDGQGGVDAALHHRPMAIIMDLAMPGMGGIEATRHIRADPRGRGAFVIVLTAHGSGTFDAARDAGCDAYFCKPFNPFALELVLRVLRSPPAEGDGTAIVKECGCGASYTYERWRALPLCGRMHVPGRSAPIELRNCPCGSSLGVALNDGLDEA